VSRLAIIKGSVAFLAPEIGIVPLSLRPPLIRMRSITPPADLPTHSTDHPSGRAKPNPLQGYCGPNSRSLLRDNSGGIVRSAGMIVRSSGRGAILLAGVLAPVFAFLQAPFGLRLAAPQVLPQGRGEALLSLLLVLARAVGHGGRLRL